ncbi:hypothetical protein ACWGJT_03815, partial [Streptomyces xantholiticus]
MIDLLVLMAIAYAGARGVESMVGTNDRRRDTKEAEKTVTKVAAGGAKEGAPPTKTPRPPQTRGPNT